MSIVLSRPRTRGLFARSALTLLALAPFASAQAFDAAKVPDGTYYNATAVNEQLWTPLFLARHGQLLDPFLTVKSAGIGALQGEGNSTLLRANTAYLYGACDVTAVIGASKGLTVDIPTVYIGELAAPECWRIDQNLALRLRQPELPPIDNPFPTFELRQPAGDSQQRWVFGVPGMLAGRYRQVASIVDRDVKGTIESIQGIVSKTSFVPLPIIEPDFVEQARVAKKPHPGYRVGLVEAVHRSEEVAIGHQEWTRLFAASKDRLAPRFQPRLLAAVKEAFNAKPLPFVEFGLVVGVDLEGTGKVDRLGVTRIGARLPSGIERWVDVVWSVQVRKGGSIGDFEILETTEQVLYAKELNFFVNKNPSLWSPHLVVSAIADFDKDKRLEIVTTVVRPVGNAYSDSGRDSTASRAIWLRSSKVLALTPQSTGQRVWSEVFRTSEHEERAELLDPNEFIVVKFGE